MNVKNVGRTTGIVIAALSMTGLATYGSTSSDAATPTAVKAVTAKTFGPGCSAVPKSGPGSFKGMGDDPVATAASNNPMLKTLTKAVTKAGLVDTLNGAKSLTVFAPTNAAFAKLPKATLAKVMANKAMLTKILTYHVISGRLGPNAVTGTHTTLEKGKVTVKGGSMSGMTVNGAHVLCGNVPTSNATVYIINKVLMPKGM